MANIKCRLCGAEVPREQAPFPVVRHERGLEKLWFCSQECMAVEWPDAKPPLAVGDMVACDYIAYEDTSAAIDLDGEYEALETCGFSYLFGEKIPYDQWAVLFSHPEHHDQFFLVPWIGQEAADEDDEIKEAIKDEGDVVCYIPSPAQAIYVAWKHKDTPDAKAPRPVLLMLGRGHWKHRNEIALSARQQQLTPESLKEAQEAFRRTMRGH